MKSVDMNCDMGEGFGAYEIGCDDDMLEIVSSMNLACGFHAGDFLIMSRLSKKAGQMGVAIGAHPGYPDLWGYGRRKMVFTNEELEAIFAYQIGAAVAMAKLHGFKMTYIKAHGAIAHLAAEDLSVGEVYANVIQKIDPSLTVLAMVNTPVIEILKSKGIRVAYEIFADRGYLDNGRLVPRGQPGAMIHDSDEAAARIVEMVSNQCIISHTGKRSQLKLIQFVFMVTPRMLHPSQERCDKRWKKLAGQSAHLVENFGARVLGIAYADGQ